MPFSLIPDHLFSSYGEVTPDYLRRRGVTLL